MNKFPKESVNACNTFTMPVHPDIAALGKSQIKSLLPHPNACGTTTCTKGGLIFPNFGTLSVC